MYIEQTATLSFRSNRRRPRCRSRQRESWTGRDEKEGGGKKNIWETERICSQEWIQVYRIYGSYGNILIYRSYGNILIYGSYENILIYGFYGNILIYWSYGIILIYGCYGNILIYGSYEIFYFMELMKIFLLVDLMEILNQRKSKIREVGVECLTSKPRDYAAVYKIITSGFFSSI